MNILVTGAAGFIGFHLVNNLAKNSQYNQIIGLDNINDYYDISLKYGRLANSGIPQNKIEYNQAVKSKTYSNYRFIKLDLQDRENILSLFKREQITIVCHLAAQAGVRYSLTNPQAYVESNIVGFMNILEACRHFNVEHLVYASSSSVYGLNEEMPFSTRHNVDHPVSLYAASKKSNELMAHTYSYLYNLPTTGLRFFTVYGPWGRPDMAYFLFVNAILAGKPIDVYNQGNMKRDFTYIDDIVDGMTRVIEHIPTVNPDWSGNQPDPSSSMAPYQLYNIGNNSPIDLLDFINTIEEMMGKKAQKNYLPLQPGDVPATWADVSDLVKDLGYQPRTTIKQGIEKFYTWYRQFYRMV